MITSSKMINKYLIGLVSLVFMLTIGLTFFMNAANAFSPNYNSNNLIDNPTFLDNAAMSASDIQTFLSNVGSGLAGYSDVEACDSTIAPYYSHCGQTLSAAQIIYDASQAYGVNPEAILATLEKEQSLVTDPTPSASQINCAMGYNSCANYVGFFTQVDNGAWALVYNYQGASRVANWLSWHPGANYPCRNSSSLYNNSLYPGNVVTFNDPGGTAETVTLVNAATASLYCYTPYVGPHNVTGYSGSYNFVYYFQLWFGSTQASVPYAWAYEGQNEYADSGETTPFTNVPTVAPGSDLYVTFTARNIGYDNWTQSSPTLHVGTSNPNDRTSLFSDTSWLGSTRPTGLSVSSVAPGGETTFSFALHAPSQTGMYNEYFNLVADGATWLNNPGLFYTIDVVTPRTVIAQNAGLASGQSINVGKYILSSDAQSTLVLQGDGNLVLYSDYKPTWWSGTAGHTNASYLAMQTDGNLVEYSSSNQPIWSSGTAGNPGAYLSLQSDGNLVVYSSTNQPLWASGSINVPGFFNTSDTTLPNGDLYPNQYLESDNGNYKLLLQTDGNLVLYYQGAAIWNTGTYGESVEYLAMQGDGNLVLYNTAGAAIWNSGTEGNGPSFLNMQDDGNLVLYTNSIHATWSSNTHGVQ